jgi:RNA polymerase sigma-B factor
MAQPKVGSSGGGEGETSPAASVSAELADDRELERRAATDPHARELLIERHQGLARALALRYRTSGESVDDLVQVASLGLVNAANRFDPERGVPFSTFAVPTILGELRRHFRDHGWSVHLPRGLKERVLETKNAIEQLNQRLQRSPTAEELAEHMGLSLDEVLDALTARQESQALSLDAPAGVSEDEDLPLIEGTGTDDPGFDAVEYREALDHVVDKLSPEERELLEMRFGEELPQREIAERLGTSQMQVSRLLRRVLDRLRILAAEREQPPPPS